MYRQNHTSFGRPSYRLGSVPENYSGNAFRKESPGEPVNKEETVESEISAPERDDECEKATENILKTVLPAQAASHDVKKSDLGIASDTALLFLVLLILAAGGGERDDGALFMILLLLML